MFELTGFTNANGPLTKRISLAPDGTVKSNGDACLMTRGEAQRVHVADVGALARVIEQMCSNQALALGALRQDLPNKVEIVTKKQLAVNGSAIARTGGNIFYRKDASALALIDHDRKGMPLTIADAVRGRGGLWPTLISVVPALQQVAHLTRWSTSAGLFRSDTGERLPGSGGLHVYITVQDGSDVERFLKTLHARCWLAGYGWFMVGVGGQLLERSIVDRMVYAPERPVFEGAPILEPPLQQDQERRRPVPTDGELMDTRGACPDLDVAERSQLRELKLKSAHTLKGESAKVRREFEERQAQALATRTGMSLRSAQQQAARQVEGILLPDVPLPFDDEEFKDCTVGDVLADPERFEGTTLADPLEGVDYGRCMARIMRRDDGTLWIHSFAHGRIIYNLKHNAASVRAAIDRATEKDAAKIFLEMIPHTHFDIGEQERLRKYVAERAEMGVREIDRLLKIAALERADKRKQEARERRARARTDPRPQIPRPDKDAEWLPQMDALNSVISKSTAPHPASRDIDDVAARTREISVPKTHAFISSEPEEKSE
jgi:hypothetical protein